MRTRRATNLIWIGLLISLPCFSAELFPRTADKTLLTMNVGWDGFTNVSQLKPIGLVSSNALWYTTTNAPPFQPGMWYRPPPMVYPKTNSPKQHRPLYLKHSNSNVVLHLHANALREVGTP